jgi:hypothetical protein
MQWDKFIIEDLGGSAKESGWNIEYYNQYPNLERVLEGYEKDIYLLVELSSTPDFSREDKVV